ncbi:hypothetical protein BKK56_06490 [Rodentibacter genomosp. 2]|uniref:restriction endonuclease subunit S n=1 Tax=Rodentibacter genomosp. 2 TaxID=1908266 RepID=UPI0009CA40CA|nr:hypothetical protein BKK56_06490 [Rodentibacter genomosp. 2]
MKRYESYKDSGVEWLEEVPEHWEVRKVKHIFRLVVEPAPKNNSQELLSVYSDIGVKPRAELEERGNKASTTDGYWVVKKGDIIINKLLAWMGAIGLSDYNGITSPAYDVLRPYQKIDGKFFHYLFRTNLCLSEFKKKSRGIMDMRLRLYFEELGNIFVPFPQYSEQQRISQYLDDKTTKIDHAISLAEKQIELLKEHKQILIQRAVTKGLDSNVEMKDSGVEWIGEVPAHWEVKKLKFVLVLSNNKEESKNSDKRYIGMENVESFTGKINDTILSAEGVANSFYKNEILFGKLRPYLTKSYLADFDGVCSTEFLVYKTTQNMNNHFALSIFLSHGFINTVNSSTYGSKMPRANSEFLSNMLLPIPPLEEQQQIAQYLYDKTAKIDYAISLKQQHIEKLKEYKSVLINDVVTGKVRV